MRIITLIFVIFPFIASANILPLDDAYRAKPTEQTAWRIGDIASVVNSYDNTDLQDVLLM